ARPRGRRYRGGNADPRSASEPTSRLREVLASQPPSGASTWRDVRAAGAAPSVAHNPPVLYYSARSTRRSIIPPSLPQSPVGCSHKGITAGGPCPAILFD